MKPFSEACERNKEPIFAVLRPVLEPLRTVLEIGSGTGQHALHFGSELPHLIWQTSDLAENHPGIRAWLAEARLVNVKPPLTLDVCNFPWPVRNADAVFTANTLHIVSWSRVRCLFTGAAALLPSGGPLCTYGPFQYDGRHTSESNASFDAFLRERDPDSGIRDATALQELAAEVGLCLADDHAMPANNRTLIWRKS